MQVKQTNSNDTWLTTHLSTPDFFLLSLLVIPLALLSHLSSLILTAPLLQTWFCFPITPTRCIDHDQISRKPQFSSSSYSSGTQPLAPSQQNPSERKHPKVVPSLQDQQRQRPCDKSPSFDLSTSRHVARRVIRSFITFKLHPKLSSVFSSQFANLAPRLADLDHYSSTFTTCWRRHASRSQASQDRAQDSHHPTFRSHL